MSSESANKDKTCDNTPDEGSGAIGVEKMIKQLDTMFKDDKSNSLDGEAPSPGPDDKFFIQLEEADKRLKKRGSFCAETGDVFEIIAGANFNQPALKT